MYETHESNIDWGKIIKKGSIILGIILAILIVFTLISKLFNKKDKDEPVKNEPVTLSEQLDIVENALLEYIEIDSLPKEINSSKTIRVKLLKDKGLIQDLTDSQKNSCESNGSFAEITRFEENYAVSITLTCGTKKENRLFYIGCFNECDGKICKGNSDSKGGVCSPASPTENTPSDTTNTNKDKDKKPTTPTKTNPSTNKPANNNTSSTKPSTSNNKNNNTTVTPTVPVTPKETLYEFKKCYNTYICSTGTLNKNTNKCEYGSKTTTSYSDFRIEVLKSKTATLNSLDTASVKYQLHEYKGGYYYYNVYHCLDSSHTYSYTLNKCYKENTVPLTKDPEAKTTCDYTWSKSKNLEGWTRTGKTK